MWDGETFPGYFESIATVVVGSAGQSTITFSNIPQNYAHLQLRVTARQAGNYVDGSFVSLQFNSDTGANYVMHRLLGDGSNASSAAFTGLNNNSLERITNASQISSNFGVLVVDILDYTNTNKFKTIKNLGGHDNNGGGWVVMNSNLWRSTSAVTRIDLGVDTGAFQQYSHFALYGIRSA